VKIYSAIVLFKHFELAFTIIFQILVCTFVSHTSNIHIYNTCILLLFSYQLATENL